MIFKLKKSTVILSCMIIVCLVIIAVTTAYCELWPKPEIKNNLIVGDVLSPLPPSPQKMGTYKRGSVVSNAGPCAEIGNKILKKYGSAVDAAIATLICDGVGCIQNMGIGGGFLMTIYIKNESRAYTLNARETAPAAATFDMFAGDSKLSQFGGLSVGVPGELRGYHEAYTRFGGKAPWHELFTDTIQLCKEGVPVNLHLAQSLASNEKEVRSSPSLSKILLSENGELPKQGDKLKLPKLAETLHQIAYLGPDVLYNGSMTKDFVTDIRDAGGIITEEDMQNYRVRWEDPITLQLSDSMTFYSSPPPGSGALLGFILKLLDNFIPSGISLTDTQRITEAFKFTYGHRTELGDPHFVNISEILSELSNEAYINMTRSKISDNKTSESTSWYGAKFYNPEDHGTANIVVLAPNGDAVAVTSTINLVFGSKLVSNSTGIVLNNEMDDFSAPNIINYFGVPPSPANFIAPGKRPMSSMCPTIIVDKYGDVRLVVGAAGGTKITTATALVSIWNLWYNKTIKEAVDAPRFHHQLWPMEWQYEYGTLKSTVNGMVMIGHMVSRVEQQHSCATSIAVQDGLINAYSDPRRPGNTSGFDG